MSKEIVVQRRNSYSNVNKSIDLNGKKGFWRKFSTSFSANWKWKTILFLFLLSSWREKNSYRIVRRENCGQNRSNSIDQSMMIRWGHWNFSRRTSKRSTKQKNIFFFNRNESSRADGTAVRQKKKMFDNRTSRIIFINLSIEKTAMNKNLFSFLIFDSNQKIIIDEMSEEITKTRGSCVSD